MPVSGTVEQFTGYWHPGEGARVHRHVIVLSMATAIGADVSLSDIDRRHRIGRTVFMTTAIGADVSLSDIDRSTLRMMNPHAKDSHLQMNIVNVDVT